MVEIRLEIRLINFVEKKQTILTLTKNFFKNRIFSKRLTHAFDKKNVSFFIRKKIEIRFKKVLDRKQTFFLL